MQHEAYDETSWKARFTLEQLAELNRLHAHRTAVHESGHALAIWHHNRYDLVPDNSPIGEIAIRSDPDQPFVIDGRDMEKTASCGVGSRPARSCCGTMRRTDRRRYGRFPIGNGPGGRSPSRTASRCNDGWPR